jgi:cyanophycinase
VHSADEVTGRLALLGTDPWRPGTSGSNAALLSGLCTEAGGEVVLLPTAAAYERPERVLSAASTFFERLGARLIACNVLGRPDAEQRPSAELLRRARLVYLTDGSPLHLRSVLKDSTALAALIAAWHEGATVVGAGAGAMVLSDPMVDPRGGAFSVGLGLVRGLAVVTGHREQRSAQLERTLALAPDGCAVVALPDRAAVVREGDGSWHAGSGGAGPGEPGVAVFVDGADEGLAALAGKPIG